MNWPYLAIGDACNVRRGTTITQTQSREGVVPVVAGGLNATYYHDTPNRQGNVITISASGANAGFVNFWSSPIFASDCSTVETDGKNVDIKFVYYFLRSQQDYINSKLRSGAAQPHVYAKDIAQLQLPLPPVTEQHRIAAILDQADVLRAKRREALAQLDSLTQSIFIEMFGDFRTDSSRWRMVKFDEIVKDSRIGLVRGSQELGPENPYRYLRMNAIARDGSLQLDGALLAKATPEELALYRLQPGDLLFNTRNSRELVGKTGLFRSDDLYLFNNNLLRVRFVEGVEPEYIFAAFKTRLIQNELEIRKSGTTNVFAVYYKDLRTLPMPVPPHDLQKTFSVRVQSIEAIKISHRAALRELDSLFASLQHRAFAGKL